MCIGRMVHGAASALSASREWLYGASPRLALHPQASGTGHEIC